MNIIGESWHIEKADFKSSHFKHTRWVGLELGSKVNHFSHFQFTIPIISLSLLNSIALGAHHIPFVSVARRVGATTNRIVGRLLAKPVNSFSHLTYPISSCGHCLDWSSLAAHLLYQIGKNDPHTKPPTIRQQSQCSNSTQIIIYSISFPPDYPDHNRRIYWAIDSFTNRDRIITVHLN